MSSGSPFAVLVAEQFIAAAFQLLVRVIPSPPDRAHDGRQMSRLSLGRCRVWLAIFL